MTKNWDQWRVRLAGAFCLVLAAALIYRWQGIFLGVCTGEIFSDVPLHIELAMGGNDYGLASFIIRALYASGDERFAQTGLAVCMTASNVLLLVTLWLLLRRLLPKLNGWYLMLAAELALLCGPWIIPGYQTEIYLGAHNGNLYHNMTVLFSRVFVPLCFLSFFDCWDARHEKIPWGPWLLFTGSFFLATFFKPNFAFAFIPLLGVMLLWDLVKYKGRFLKNEVILGCMVLPAGFVCLWQYSVLFSSSFAGTSSQVALKTYMAAELLAVMVMLIRSLLLPIYSLSLQGPREEQRSHIWLIVLTDAVAILEATFLTETGYRATDGNFDWGGLAIYPVIFSLSIGLLFRMIQEADLKRPKDVIKCLLGVVLLLGHLAIGAYFLRRTFFGGDYFV